MTPEGPRTTRKILIAGGGFVSAPFIRYMAQLTGKPRPRVCYLPTAVGDRPDAAINFYKACATLEVTPLEHRPLGRSGIEVSVVAVCS